MISSSFEFGGFSADATDREALMAQYLSFMGSNMPPVTTFERGDCNEDGSFNIADAIHGLANLFPPASGQAVINCYDACDANDDGAFNIADMVRLLGGLFGTPATPLAAPFGACGADNTGVPNCVDHASCP